MHRRRTVNAAALTLIGLSAASVTARADVTVASGSLGFQVYNPPAALGGTSAFEPSIGADHTSDTTMYQAGLQTFAVKFDTSTSPATASWKDVSAPLTSQTSLDPILFTDSARGRTFVSQLTGADSLSEFTDNDGATYTPSQGGGIPSGPDHQSIGAGPYSLTGLPPQPTVYPDAVYYCSQAVATAFCARSDTGGLNYGAGVPIYNADQCGGLHGHVRVAQSGMVMVPNQSCDKQVDPSGASLPHFPFQAAVTSMDNGNTWSVQTIPDSHASLRSDPSVAADDAGRLYFGYEDAVRSASDEQVGGHANISVGTVGAGGAITWSPSTDVGAAVGVQNVQFPEVIAGDDGRAAYAFLGSTTAGDPEDVGFTGHWDLYVAVTTDAGKNWTVTDTTPTDPVERGCTFLGGIDPTSANECPNPAKRNLYDFMDITVSEDGHVLVGFADGCIGTCAAADGASRCQSADFPADPQVCDSGTSTSTSELASIARLQCGPSLYVEYAHTYACPPAGQVPEAPWVPGLTLAAAGLVGLPAILRRRRDTCAA